MHKRTCGFTLTEVLVALLIGVIAVGVVYLLYNTVYRVGSGQDRIGDTGDAVSRALHTLSRDLASSLVPEVEDQCAVSLETPDDFAELEFCTAVSDGRGAGPEWHEVHRVAYRVLPGGEGGPALVRTSRRLTGPGSFIVETNTLVRNVRSFRVLGFDGTEWTANWNGPDHTGLPLAARLSISQVGGEEAGLFTEVYIPYGNKVESSIKRGSAPPPAQP